MSDLINTFIDISVRLIPIGATIYGLAHSMRLQRRIDKRDAADAADAARKQDRDTQLREAEIEKLKQEIYHSVLETSQAETKRVIMQYEDLSRRFEDLQKELTVYRVWGRLQAVYIAEHGLDAVPMPAREK